MCNLALLIGLASTAAQVDPLTRAQHLVARMTLEEKLGMLQGNKTMGQGCVFFSLLCTANNFPLVLAAEWCRLVRSGGGARLHPSPPNVWKFSRAVDFWRKHHRAQS
jgi:hypothetical protein